jgi:hypothetical protein
LLSKASIFSLTSSFTVFLFYFLRFFFIAYKISRFSFIFTGTLYRVACLLIYLFAAIFFSLCLLFYIFSFEPRDVEFFSGLKAPFPHSLFYISGTVQEQIACWLIGPKSRRSWLNCFPNSRERSTGKSVFAFPLSVKQCCGTESRGAEIKLPPGAGAEITNCGSGSFFLFTTDFKKFYWKKMVAEICKLLQF